jgi:hypothetical protein
MQMISTGAQKRARQSRYARATPSLRPPAIPRFTMICVRGSEGARFHFSKSTPGVVRRAGSTIPRHLET